MHTDYRDFEYFNFHDSFFVNAEVYKNRLVWYLDGVNVSPQCRLNPNSCSMMASEMKLEFIDCKISKQQISFDKAVEGAYEILENEKISESNESFTYSFSVVGSEGYFEIELSFSDVHIEWERYKDKAWYVFFDERNFVKKFLSENPQIEWLFLSNEQSTDFVKELHSELNEHHTFYCIEASAYAKSESEDDVLFSLSNGKCAIIHLTYSKQNIDGYPKFIEFESIEEALENIKQNFSFF